MSTLTITIGIVAPVITFLIGRYFRSEKINNIKKSVTFWHEYADSLELSNRRLNESNQLLHIQNTALLSKISELAAVQIVPNINPHHAADTEYIGIYPNNGSEPAHLTREEYQKGVDRLKDNPEDNILTKPTK
jgi:hypothetical protein